jgi:type IV secretory pathway VirB2 component (pilin)
MRMFNISLILSALSILPLIAFAQAPAAVNSDQYTLLAPFGSYLTGSVTMKEYLKGIFQVIIGIAGILAVIMIVICGIKYMGSGDNSGARSEAKECVWNAIFGILIALGAWLLLNTINPLLLADNLNITTTPGGSGEAGSYGPQTEPDPILPLGFYFFKYTDTEGSTLNGIFPSAQQCVIVRDIYEANGNTITKECALINAPKTPPEVLPGGDEATTRARLCGDEMCACKDSSCRNGIGNVGVNKSPCIPANRVGSCTNVAGLPADAVDFIKGLEQECNCNIVITGGTEGGHKTHRPNVPIFDLRYDSASPLTNIIKGTQAEPLISYLSFAGNRRWEHGGYWFTDETSSPSRHWHVCRAGLPDGTSIKYCQDPTTDKGKKWWYP